MIDELSRTLRAILTKKEWPEEWPPGSVRVPMLTREKFPDELGKVEHITFDRPDDKSKPAEKIINLFLYDIRENLDLRSNELVIERRNGDVITHRPPLRVACSYLVTAWPIGVVELALQEQRLLSQVLQVFSQLPTIPAHFLQGNLKKQSLPLPMVTALVDPQKNLSEFWTALGSQLRPSLTLTAIFEMEAPDYQTDAMVVTDRVRLEPAKRISTDQEQVSAGMADELFRIGGRVTDASNSPVKGASVAVKGLGLKTTTDGDGRFILEGMKPGGWILRIKADAKAKAQEKKINVPKPDEQPPRRGKGEPPAISFDVRLT